MAQLKSQIETRVNYIEWKGQKVPLSPDGIPMLNYAKTYNDIARRAVLEGRMKQPKTPKQ